MTRGAPIWTLTVPIDAVPINSRANQKTPRVFLSPEDQPDDKFGRVRNDVSREWNLRRRSARDQAEDRLKTMVRLDLGTSASGLTSSTCNSDTVRLRRSS